MENRIRNTQRAGRQRSISTSREPVNKRPPLLTAISDPSLVKPSSSVLTQLLTNSKLQFSLRIFILLNAICTNVTDNFTHLTNPKVEGIFFLTFNNSKHYKLNFNHVIIHCTPMMMLERYHS